MTSLSEIYAAINTLTLAENNQTQAITGSSNAVGAINSASSAQTAAFATVVTAINNLTASLKVFNLSAGSTVIPATPGTLTFLSSEAVGFLLVTTSSGATVKVPYYSNP